MPAVNKDTVEEFWDADVLAHCRDQATRVGTSDFLAQLGQFLGTSGKMWATDSARFALHCLLRDIVSPEKKTVLLCSFNCPVVADAVLQAGCQIETFDLDDATGRIDWEHVEKQMKPHHGALVVPHLFGVPTDFRAICETANKLDIRIIEDCAPTLGGKIDGVMAGVIGDAAIFSFNYDKPISLGGGGVLLVNNPDLWPRINLVPQTPDFEDEDRELNVFVSYLQKRRSEIRRPLASLPIRLIRRMKRRIKSVQVDQETLLPVSGIGPLRAALGLWQLERYPDIIHQRNKNATLFTETADGRSWFVDAAVTPAWLRQKVLPGKGMDVGKISQNLQNEGLRVGLLNWPVTLDAYLNRSERPNAYHAATRNLDIPIHQNMTPSELDLIRQTVCGETKT